MNTNEFNVLYKLDKNVAALAGWVNAKGTFSDTLGYINGSTNTQNLWQIGAVASTAIADKTTLWGSAAVGNNLTNYEVGVSYEFSPGWEFNVNYRDLELRNFSFLRYTGLELKGKGTGFGVTYKF